SVHDNYINKNGSPTYFYPDTTTTDTYCGDFDMVTGALVDGSCGGTSSTKFSINDRVQVSSGPLNVRATPNTTGTLLGIQATGALGTVIGGPTAQGGFNWWQITYDAAPSGWSVEDFLTKVVADITPPVIT